MRFNTKFQYINLYVFLIFSCRSVKKGIQVVQILKMKTLCMLYDMFCLFYYYLVILVLLARCIV